MEVWQLLGLIGVLLFVVWALTPVKKEKFISPPTKAKSMTSQEILDSCKKKVEDQFLCYYEDFMDEHYPGWHKSRYIGKEYPFGKYLAARKEDFERAVNQLFEEVTRTGNTKLLEIYPRWYDTED